MTTCSHTNDINTSIKNPTSRLAHMMAKIILSFNIPINQWIEQLKFHMVILAQSNNPKHNTIELAAMTGLDRRYVTKTLKTGEIKRTNSKIDKVLEKIRQICHYKHTDTIQIYGKRNTFASTCKTISSTSLSTKAIASELIRRGEIIDQGNNYRIANLTTTLLDDTVICSETEIIIKILAAIKKVCVNNNTKKIDKHGKNNSFESICKDNPSEIFNTENISESFLSRNILVDLGNQFWINEDRYIVPHSNKVEYIEMMSIQLLKYTNTLIFNQATDKKNKQHYQMQAYSTQLNPDLFTTIRPIILKKLKKVSKEITLLLEKHEEKVPYDTYPQFGVSLFGFDELNPSIYIPPM